LLLFLLVCGISTVYIGWDLERVNRVVLRYLPERHRTRVCAFRASLFSGLLPYARSYLILMLLTFAVVSVGLALLGVEYVLLLSALIALLDALPVIGVGTVLIPWSLFELLLGRVPLGVGLLVLYVIHELIRQIAEPRILGRNMGLHPLLTLILLYGGYTLLGFLGLLLLPVLTVTLHAVMRVRSEREGEKAIAHDRDAPPRT
jgi:sporulation integral membrane protein YtvI